MVRGAGFDGGCYCGVVEGHPVAVVGDYVQYGGDGGGIVEGVWGGDDYFAGVDVRCKISRVDGEIYLCSVWVGEALGGSCLEPGGIFFDSVL